MQQLTTEEKKAIFEECRKTMHTNQFSHIEFEKAAIRIAETGAFEAGGYHSFENFHRIEFPVPDKLSKRKYQLLKYAEVVADIAQYQQVNPSVYQNGQHLVEKNILPENERQTRELAPLPHEDRGPAWELTVEANGKFPTGEQVKEVVQSLQPSRLDFVDTDPAPQPAAQPEPEPDLKRAPKHHRAWAEDLCVAGRYLQFYTCDYPFTLKNGKTIKTHILTAMKLIDLSDLGFIYRNDRDALRAALKELDENEEIETEEPSEAQTFAPDDTGYIDQTLNSFFGDD